MAEFALGIGSNMGNRIWNLTEGIRFLLSRYGMGHFRLSGVYETPPIEEVEGGSFLNCVFTGNFNGTAAELHKCCREAEILMGSTVNKQNSSRILDIDLLFFGDTVRNDEDLILPHPAIQRRKFVLEPLSEVWPGTIPGLNATPDELLKKCSDTSRISRIYDMPAVGCFWEVPS